MQFSDKIAPLKPSAIREIFKVLGDPSIISLAGGNPAPETFPVKEFQTLSAKLFEENGKNALQYGLTEGYLPLRKKITERLKEKLGIGRDFDETIVVTGGQQGVDLTCKILCNEGDVVLCEDPSFIGALNAFRSYNTRLVGIPVDDCGMQIDKLEQALKKEKKAKHPALAQHISTLFVVFLLGMALVVQYTYIQNLGYQISQSKNELKTVQDENEKIKKQIAAMGELQNVENIAVNNMGMHKPNEWEIIYLPQIEQPEKQSEDEGSLDQAANQVKDIIGTIMP